MTLYLLPDLNLRLRPKQLEMRPGTRVVSHMFKMQDWEPDETSYLGNHAGTRSGRFTATRTEPKALSGLQVSSVRIM